MTKEKIAIEAYWPSHYSHQQKSPENLKISKLYKKKTGRDMSAGVALGYDTAMVIAEAIKTQKDQMSLPDSIRSLPNQKGLTGTMSFQGRQSPRKSMFIRKITKDGIREFTEIRP